MEGIMVKEQRISICWVAGGRKMPPPSTSTLEVFSPQGGQTTEQEKVAVGDVMGMMISFQRMFEALINLLDRDEGRYFVPNEGSLHPLLVSVSVQKELEKVKFPEFMGSTDSLAIEAWLENMEM
jgi:hypothetical protein